MTYSIVARDPATGELGIAVQSRFFAVERIVPHIEAGVGVIAAQAFADPACGPEGLRLLRSGSSAPEVVRKLAGSDGGAARLLQIAVLDTKGGVAAHTGASCVAAAGHLLGAHCSAQANMMRPASVWPAMVAAFERTSGGLADRLLEAMEAAEREGGDIRGRRAAALVVVSASPQGGRLVDLRVDDHADPVGEIGRQLAFSRAHGRAGEALAKTLAGDLAGALDDLDACCHAFPKEPDFLTRRALVLLALGRAAEARETMERAYAIHPGWAEFVRRFAEAQVVPMPPAALISLVEGLKPPGAKA